MNKFANRTVEILRLPGERNEDTIERILGAILPIADDFAEFFGEQTPNIKVEKVVNDDPPMDVHYKGFR